MKRLIGRLPGFVTSFWNDTSGIVMVYAAITLPVVLGFSIIALDGARLMSLQSQMQAAADALALAGARELDGKADSDDRAISAMANAYSGTPNSLIGMGTAPTLAYTYAFYKSLPAATAGITGVAADTDLNRKFVAVSVTPVTVSTILPIGSNTFSAGAQAIAGFLDVTVCNVTPVFICNPYETVGNTNDADATLALHTSLSDAATLRRQLRLDRSNTSPGHFGWLQAPLDSGGDCNNANCQKDNLAKVGGACYDSKSVRLATGNRNNVDDFFDTRFDMYNQSPPPSKTATNAPAKNVRKGFLPKQPNNPNWCSLDLTIPPTQYYTTRPVNSTPIVSTTGTVSGNGNARKTISAMPAANVSIIQVGQMISGTNIPTLTTVVSKPTTTSITISNQATGSGVTSVTVAIKWPTSPLPLDQSWTGICSGGTCVQGNGEWDCDNYWRINHGAAPPANMDGAGGVCGTGANTTISRYHVYRYEIDHPATPLLLNDWSGNTLANTGNNPPGNGESGAPFCAAASGVSPVDTTTGGLDRRQTIVAIINCEAQTAAGHIAPGNATSTVPVAGFGKFFLTQPFQAPAPPAPAGNGNPYLYGEMTGLVQLNDNVTILNQVQLYR